MFGEILHTLPSSSLHTAQLAGSGHASVLSGARSSAFFAVMIGTVHVCCSRRVAVYCVGECVRVGSSDVCAAVGVWRV